MVKFWLVPNEMGFHTIKYFGYLVKIGQNSGYMVNFRGCLEASFEAVDALGYLDDAVRAAGGRLGDLRVLVMAAVSDIHPV